MTYSNADFTPSLKGYSNVKPFRFWCQKVLPLVYDDSLSYYELLCKVVDYLNNVISDLSATEDNVGDLLTAYNQLQDYVNNYFTNLDVQEEINTKLDAMFEDGTIPTMIEEYVHPFIEELNENYAELDSQINETMTTQNENIATLTTRVNNLVINNTTNLTGYNVVTVESTTAQGGSTVTENIPVSAEILQVCYSGYNDTNDTIKSDNISYESTPNVPTSTQQQVVVTITDATDTRFHVFITYAISQDIEIAELTDIRVGYDNTVYSSAGDAVRGQVSDLKNAFDYVHDAVFAEIDSGVTPTIVLNGIGITSGLNTPNTALAQTYYNQRISNQVIKLLNNNWKPAVYWYTSNERLTNNYLGRTTYFNSNINQIDILLERKKNGKDSATHFAIVFYRWTGTEIDTSTTITNEELSAFNDNYVLLASFDAFEKATINRILVSASDSESLYKAVADFQCTGVNDELTIQSALDKAVNEKKELWLASGNYYIDSFYPPDHEGDGYHAIWLKLTQYQHTTVIKGIGGKPIRKYGTQNDIDVGAVLRVSQSCYDSLDANKQYAVICGNGNAYNSRQYPWLDVEIKNIGIVIPDNQKKIIGIDGYYLTKMNIENVVMMCSDAITTTKNGVSGCIGVRGMCGSAFGTGQEWKNCFVWGFHTGYAVAGEHLVCTELGAKYCDYGYRFNDFVNGVGGYWRHPITMINCCDECNFNMPYFGNGGQSTIYRQAINLINFNLEWYNTYYAYGGDRAKEEIAGCAYANIEFSLDHGNKINSASVPFWEDGYGENSKTRNLAHKLSGSTSERSGYGANPHQQYYDTNLNKMLVYENGEWVDFMGNQAS